MRFVFDPTKTDIAEIIARLPKSSAASEEV
jgi:hypothetical protein